MKKSISSLVLPFFVVLMMFSGLFPQVSSAATYTATIDRVVDGDTVYLKELIKGTNKVRMLSIDTPETNYNGQAQEPWGTAAKNYLTQLLPSGTKVTIETDTEETDAYGRLLAHIHKGTLDVNKEMVRQGHAVTYYIWPNMLHFEEYQQAYLEAKQNGRGMWNPSNPINELPFEFRDRVSGQPQDKYVGDFYTKLYVSPADYQQVPIEKRVFFFTESDAQAAGYTKKSSGGGGSTNLVINEVLPASGTIYTKEFVEIYNPADSAVDLSGYVLDDIVNGGSSPYTIPNGTIIPAKGYFVWETNNYYNNTGDDVTLKAPNGTITDQYHYSTSSADKSWARIPNGGNWSTTMDSTPTKGAINN
ncbi:non specific extracellular endonuclease cleaving RNA and DNA [Bacillus methanolicus PB1]|uniref:Non specific extracellular endonuclease cleaving RNA and DNA n=1 Tax=Bacillus methanolicus PB1 TaxID=997296 RepID=I3DVL7_BACMT|nr:thermonuclease family protein [Bacillus methanolicus]EIJ78288.1 non specific extracellular endonuclease cleaving RNA and DNA [Bacillus methanolicus PB1]